jgi:tetratricopeptide (TPR) repeat protein
MKMIRPVFLLFVLLIVSPAFAEDEVKDYNALLSEGVIQLNQNDLPGASRLFEQAIAQDEQGVEAYYYLGVVYARMNLSKEAENSFKKALKLDPLFISAHYDFGVLYYETKSNEEAALASFDIVQKADPNRARVYFYQGLILRRLGKFKQAAAKFEEAARLDTSLATEAYHQAGEAYLQANDIAASKNALQKVIAINPESMKAKEAQEYLKNLYIPEVAQSKGSQFSASLLTGFLYDDNVLLESSGTASQSEDTVSFLSALGRYQFKPNKNVAYRFYQNYHSHSDRQFRDYDVQDHNFSLNISPLRFQDRLNLDYQFQFAFLGNEHYLNYYTFGTQYLYEKSDTRVTELSYQLQVKRYYNIEQTFPTSSDRNAISHQVGVRHAVLLDSDINLRVSYLFELDRAGSSSAEDDWSFMGHRVKSGITLPAWRKLTTAVDFEYLFRPYDNDNEFAPGTKRRDQGYLVNIIFSRPLGERFQLVFSYIYQRNDSNIASFDYSRSVYGLLTTVRF